VLRAPRGGGGAAPLIGRAGCHSSPRAPARGGWSGAAKQARRFGCPAGAQPQWRGERAVPLAPVPFRAGRGWELRKSSALLRCGDPLGHGPARRHPGPPALGRLV